MRLNPRVGEVEHGCGGYFLRFHYSFPCFFSGVAYEYIHAANLKAQPIGTSNAPVSPTITIGQQCASRAGSSESRPRLLPLSRLTSGTSGAMVDIGKARHKSKRKHPGRNPAVPGSEIGWVTQKAGRMGLRPGNSTGWSPRPWT